MLERFIPNFTKKLDKELSLVSESILSGSATDYADYKRMCGVIKGLRLSHKRMGEAAKEVGSEEWDE